jgi:hypothetical protein
MLPIRLKLSARHFCREDDKKLNTPENNKPEEEVLM